MEQILGQRLDVDARNGLGQQQLEQLVIGEGLGAFLQQLLAETLPVAEGNG